MTKLLNWILPKDMWKGFYLDPWIFTEARYRDGEIVGYQVVFHSFWDQIKDIYGQADTEE